MTDEGHWWRDPFGLTKILREQGVLDEDEFALSKEDYDKEVQGKDRYNCRFCEWEYSNIQSHPCNDCSRNRYSGVIGRMKDAYVSRIGIWRAPR